MLGVTGSPKTTAAWKSMLRAVTLAAASTGVPIKALRSGSGKLQPLANVSKAADPCFFSGCGSFAPVTSSIDSLWKAAGPDVPLRVAISDLEVNDGEISGLVAAMKPHINKGAVIGVLAVKLPFEGSVYNSQGVVLHTGSSQRPIYLLATGPRSQVKSILSDIRAKASMGGVPTGTMKVTFLDDLVSRPTIKAVSVQGVPPTSITSGLPVRLAGTTYSPAGQSDYQFVRLQPLAQGVRLSSTASAGAVQAIFPDFGLAQLEPVAKPGAPAQLGQGLAVKGVQILGKDLVMELSISPNATAAPIRATVPRGQLPEDWWISWNRSDAEGEAAREQTDGLLLLLTSLGRMLVEPKSTPAVAFCLAFSH